MAGSPGPRARDRSCTRRRKRQRPGAWPCCALAIVSALILDDGARTFWVQVPNWRRDEAPPVPFQFRKARRLGRKPIGERWDNWIRAPAKFAGTVEFIRKFRTSGRLLDVGCAYGFFLHEAKTPRRWCDSCLLLP